MEGARVSAIQFRTLEQNQLSRVITAFVLIRPGDPLPGDWSPQCPGTQTLLISIYMANSLGHTAVRMAGALRDSHRVSTLTSKPGS